MTLLDASSNEPFLLAPRVTKKRAEEHSTTGQGVSTSLALRTQDAPILDPRQHRYAGL